MSDKRIMLECRDTRPCFARGKDGRCTILSGGAANLELDDHDETPNIVEVYKIQPWQKNVRFKLTPYADGACPYCKPCINDVVVGGKVKRDGPRRCADCVGKMTGCKTGGA